MKKDLKTYDTIIFDVDLTLLYCFSKDGSQIPAYKTKPPYKKSSKNENVLYDSIGNKIEFQPDMFENVVTLHELKKNLYIVSKSENKITEVQPVEEILKAFNIYDYFDDIILDGDGQKSEHVNNIEDGDTIFIDDDRENIIDVKNKTKVDVSFPDSVYAKNEWYKYVLAETELEEESSIKEDIENINNGIYILKDNNGFVNLKINEKGEVLEVSNNYLVNHPEADIFVGQILPKEIVEQIKNINEENLDNLNKKLVEIEQNKEYSDYDDNDILSAIRETNLLGDDKKLEEATVRQDKNSKFAAGVVYLKRKDNLGEQEAKNIALQIANYNVYGSFDGTIKEIFQEGFDKIPKLSEDLQPASVQGLYPSCPEDMMDDELKLYLKSKAEKINKFVNDNIYMYENNGEFSGIFSQKYPNFVKRQIKVKEQTEDILNKMKTMVL